MLYLVLGEDDPRKQAKVAELKKKYLRSADALQLDFDVLYADRCDSRTLKKSLLSLPAVSPHRVLLIHNGHKLKTEGAQMLLEVLPGLEQLVVILEAQRSPFKGRGRKSATDLKMQVFDYPLPEGRTVFQMTEAMSRRQADQALKILTELMDAGQHPLQIMGGVLWFWKKMQRRMTGRHFEQGLRYLQETDIHIKRSRIRPQYAMEVLVVQLTGLLS